jgi:hypothetical protein
LHDLDEELPMGELRGIFEVGPVWVVIECADVDGRIEAIRIEIWGRGSPQVPVAYPIRAADLRRIPIGRLIDQTRQEIAEEARLTADADPPIPAEQAERYLRLLDKSSFDAAQKAEALVDLQMHRFFDAVERKKGGRPALEPSELEETVRAYREAFRGGLHPNRVVAERLHLTTSAVAKRIQRARALGMLPPTRRGVAKA